MDNMIVTRVLDAVWTAATAEGMDPDVIVDVCWAIQKKLIWSDDLS